MQPLSGRVLNLLIHLCLLTVLLAVFVATTSPRRSPSVDSGETSLQAEDSYETNVSAFKVPQRRTRPPMDNPAVRRAVDVTFAGIPQRGALLGDPEAPVTMRFLADPECPEARQFAVKLLPRLVRRWVRSGRLRIEYLGEREETIWPEVFKRQQRAVLAAGQQGSLWQYLELFYHYQGPEFTRYASSRFLKELAEEVPGLDIDEWTRDRQAPALASRVERDLDIAKARGIAYTPAFLIGPTGGRLEPLLHFTLTGPLAFEAAFREALGRETTPSVRRS